MGGLGIASAGPPREEVAQSGGEDRTPSRVPHKKLTEEEHDGVSFNLAPSRTRAAATSRRRDSSAEGNDVSTGPRRPALERDSDSAVKHRHMWPYASSFLHPAKYSLLRRGVNTIGGNTVRRHARSSTRSSASPRRHGTWCCEHSMMYSRGRSGCRLLGDERAMFGGAPRLGRTPPVRVERRSTVSRRGRRMPMRGADPVRDLTAPPNSTVRHSTGRGWWLALWTTPMMHRVRARRSHPRTCAAHVAGVVGNGAPMAPYHQPSTRPGEAVAFDA